jgi:flagellar basal body-associated protein FliL
MDATTLNTLLYLLIVLVVTAISLVTVIFIKKKSKELKEMIGDETASQHIDIFEQIVLDCVLKTKDTYITALKDANLFDEEAQKEAINKTY